MLIYDIGGFIVMHGVLSPPCYSNINLIFITYQVPRGNPGEGDGSHPAAGSHMSPNCIAMV